MPKIKRVLALDMGTSSIKAAEFVDAGGGKLQVTNFGYRRFSSDADRISSAVDLISSGKFKSKHSISAISGRNVITRYIVMQNLPDDEIKEAIQFEADKYIPFGVEEVVLDGQRIELLHGGDQMRVLLVAVKRNVVEDHIKILQQLDLQPIIIDVEAFAVGNAFLNSVKPEAGTSVALVDIGHSKTNIVVMNDQKTMFNREVYLGAHELMEALERQLDLDADGVEAFAREPGNSQVELFDALSGPLDDLCNEITLSFEFFENEYDKAIDSVWLSGGGALVADVSAEFSNRLVRPTQVWDPLSDISLRGTPAQTTQMQGLSRKLAVLMGLGTRVRKET